MIQDPIRFSPCGELQALTNPTDNGVLEYSSNDEYDAVWNTLDPMRFCLMRYKRDEWHFFTSPH